MSLDPLALFKVPADGEYVLGIEDTEGRKGPLFVYRIEIEPVRETVLTHISTNQGAPSPRLPGIAVPRGSSTTVDVDLAPGLGTTFKGDLILEAAGLPHGVEMNAPMIKAGQNRVPVLFTAAADAETQIQFFTLRVKAADGKTALDSGSHQSFATMNRGTERALHVGFLDRYAMAVTQAAPFTLEVDVPKSPLVKNGELALKARVVRAEGFKDPIEISGDWLPPNVSKGGVMTIAPDKTEAEFVIRAAGNAAPGSYQIVLDAKAGAVRISSGFVALTVAEPFLKVTMRRASVEQGRSGEIVAAVELAKTFTGEAVLALKNLPKGVRMVEPAPRVVEGTKEVVFAIQADGDALAGLYKDIACEAALTIDGGMVHERAGSGLLRVDPVRVVAEVAK
jgi:hypothetical protein